MGQILRGSGLNRNALGSPQADAIETVGKPDGVRVCEDENTGAQRSRKSEILPIREIGRGRDGPRGVRLSLDEELHRASGELFDSQDARRFGWENVDGNCRRG